MARGCDHGTCRALAITIGSYTNGLREGTTRAACSEEHRVEIHRELQFQGFTPTWLPFKQPEGAPRGGTPRPPAPSVCRDPDPAFGEGDNAL